MYYHWVPILPGTHWKSGILSFTFTGLGNAWNLIKKSEKPGILTQNMANSKLVNLVFRRWTVQDVIYKIFHLHLCHIYIINNTHCDSKPNWPGFSLLLPGDNLENTWNVVSQEQWEPWICWQEQGTPMSFNLYQDIDVYIQNLKHFSHPPIPSLDDCAWLCTFSHHVMVGCRAIGANFSQYMHDA